MFLALSGRRPRAGLWGQFQNAKSRETNLEYAGLKIEESYPIGSVILYKYWASDYMHAPVNGAPLIARDMSEHRFHMDYGAAAARYVDAVMVNLDWEMVEQRYQATKAKSAVPSFDHLCPRRV